MTSTARLPVAPLLLAGALALGGCAEDDGEAINPRPVPDAGTPAPTPTPGQDLVP